MKTSSVLKFFLPLLIVVFAFTSCDMEENPVKSFGEAVEKVHILDVIPGADNVIAKVTKNANDSYFNFVLRNIAPNAIINDGMFNGWCVVWDTPIQTGGTEYGGVKLYSTKGDPRYNHLNYLLNVQEHYKKTIEGTTWKEIQVAIWVTFDFPKFDINNIDINNIPRDFREGDQFAFNKDIVNEIVADVKKNSPRFEHQPGYKFGILAETEKGVQNGLIEGCETMWARMNNDPDDFTHEFNVDEGNWATYVKHTPTPVVTTFYFFADQTIFVGYLRVWRENNDLKIKYELVNGFLMTESHLHVALDFDDIPTSPGPKDNPQIGLFTYGQDPYDPPVSEDTFTIPWDTDWDNKELFIAAHGVVCDIEVFD